MNLKETELKLIAKVLDALGGEKVEDADGGYWLFSAGAVFLAVTPFIRQTSDELKVGIDVSMSNPELSRLVNLISGKKGRHRRQFDWRQWQRTVRSGEDVESALRGMMQEAVAEMQTVTLDDLVAKFAREHPGDRSLSQLMHLAALSYLGDFVALEEYRVGMLSGRRFGFVPMITVSFLERAIEEAMARGE